MFNTGCSPDRYGPDCKSYCPCDGNGHGHCTTGSYGCKCDPGWKGWRCDTKCASGKYGHDCANKYVRTDYYNCI